MEVIKNEVNKTILNSEGFFELNENESLVITVNGTEQLNYTVPAGKTAKINILISGEED